MKKWMVVLVMCCLISLPASAALTHQYPFDTDASDVVGTADGTLLGAASVSDGSLQLSGSDSYMSMDGSVIALNGYTDVTLEIWYTPAEGEVNTGFTMLAFFGDSDNTDPQEGIGTDYLFMSTARGDDVSKCAICLGDVEPWTAEDGVTGTEYDDFVQHHMVATLSATEIGMFLDGIDLGTDTLAVHGDIDNTAGAAGISQVLAWLGKGGYGGDPEWVGTIQEFRIYDNVLSAPAVVLNSELGPDKFQACVLDEMTPANAAPSVQRDPTSLSWASSGITVSEYQVYISTDPNLADPNQAITEGVGVADYVTTDVTQDVSGLTPNKVYYWRVDTIEDGTGTRYIGPMYSFTTVPATVVIVEEPQNVLVDSGTNASFTVTTGSPSATFYEWHKEGVTDALPEGGKYQNVDSDTLTVVGVTPADEGQYFCKVSNALPSEDETEHAYLWTKRLMGHWKLDGDLLDSVRETVADASIHDGNMVASEQWINPDPEGDDGPTINQPSNGDPNYVDEVGYGVAPIIGSNAMRFTNNGDHVEIPDAGFFNFYPMGMTVSFWIRYDSQPAWRVSLGKLDAAARADTGAGWLFGKAPGDPAVFIVENPNNTLTSTDAVDAADGEWHMMTTTYDPADTTIRLFVDGDEEVSTDADLSEAPLAVLPLAFGGLPYENSIDGAIDDVKIYSYARTPTEIATEYTNVRTDAFVCVEDPENPLGAVDINNDCRVNLEDVAEIALKWLECQRIPVEDCLL